MNKDSEEIHKKAVLKIETLTDDQQIEMEIIKTKKNDEKNKKKKLKRENLRLVILNPMNFIGIPVIIIGLIFLLNPLHQNLKIGINLVIIGTFIFFLITDKNNIRKTNESMLKKTINNTNKRRIPISVKLTIALIIWGLFLYIILDEIYTELFFILIFVGLLIAKELTDEYTSKNLKLRMNILILIFLILFITIIAQKIINILDI